MIARISEELQTEYHRYTHNKYGKLVALGIYYLLFTQVPSLLSRVVPFLMERLSQETVFIIIIFGSMAGIGLVLNLFMWFVYKIKHPFFQQYRVDANREWPWQKNEEQWNSRFWRTVGLNILNLCIVAPMLFYIDCHMQFTYIMDMNKTPTIKQLLKYLLLFHILEDFFFFTTHYLLHTPFLYKHVHKIHHQYNTTVVTAGLHFHIVEFLISNSIPAKLYLMLTGYILGPIHVTTVTIWMFLRIADAYNGHSGYIFSWAPLQLLPFCANDDFHDFHHSRNFGNYGSQFRFWDSIFGTNEVFRDFKRKQRQQLNAQKQK